jgi:hypothetical protein
MINILKSLKIPFHNFYFIPLSYFLPPRLGGRTKVGGNFPPPTYTAPFRSPNLFRPYCSFVSSLPQSALPMTKENTYINPQRTKEIIIAATNAVKNHLIEILHPEDEFIKLCQQQGGNDFALNALFLFTTLTRGQRTRRQFDVVTQNWKPEFTWVFQPGQVVKKPESEVVETCKKFFSPAGFPASIIENTWYYNCQLLHAKNNDKVANFFEDCHNDARVIKDALVVIPRTKTVNKISAGAFLGFGEKLATLVIQQSLEYNLVQLTNTNDVGIPVDGGISKLLGYCSAYTLCRDGLSAFQLANRVINPEIQKIIYDSSLPPSLISNALWNISSQRCARNLHEGCPLSYLCNPHSVVLINGKFFPAT